MAAAVGVERARPAVHHRLSQETRAPGENYAATPAPRRRTPKSDIDDVRNDLLYNLQGVEHARTLIESYVTPENIAHLEDDPIVPRLLRLTRFVYGEMHQIWEDAERFGWQPPET
jgi:hypothetical protein